MARVGLVMVAILAALMPATAALADDDVSQVNVENCIVTSFYGVPLSLKLSQLDELHIDHTRAYGLGEGDYYPEATLLVGKNVLLQLEFTTDKEPVLYQLKTSSPSAVGPRGVAIGATLKEVQRKWPEGDLYWTNAHGPYVAFNDGTNVYFEFDPREMPAGAFDNPPVPVQNARGEWLSPPRTKVIPDPEKLKVTEIRIAAGRPFHSCPNSERKK